MLGIIAKLKIMISRIVLYPMLYVFGKLIKTDENVILFASFNGKAYSDNPRYLFEYLKKQPQFANTHFVWALNQREVIDGAEVVKFNSLRYYYVLSQAKYWVFNAKMAPYYYKKTNQVYLQMWHGTPLKRLGHDIADNGTTYYRSKQSYTAMVKSYDNDARHWNYLISPNPFASRAFLSAFNQPQVTLLETGYPRVDVLVNADEQEIKRLKRQYGVPLNKQVILYAPTWRDNSFGTAGYTFDLQVDFSKWHDRLGDDYIILFKPHYLISNQYQVPADLAEFVKVVDAEADINDAYLMSDCLVTDYSSVFFDFAVRNRPIYFYMYDFDDYEQELRGFYLNVPDDLPNDIARTENELLDMMTQQAFDFARLNHFNQTFNTWQDGHASEKIVKDVFNEI